MTPTDKEYIIYVIWGLYILLIEKEENMAITVKHGSKKSIPLMKALWREVFGDSEEFTDAFFSSFYRPSRTLLAFENGELVSMLYYLDVNAKYFKKKYKCAYLYGVATKLSERRRGHFSMLHRIMEEELRAKHYDGILVLPADEPLYGLYRSKGYTIALKKFEYRLLTPDITETDDIEAVWRLKQENYKRSSVGLAVLETLPQFIESRREHKFFRHGNSYLIFAPTSKGYSLYETVEAYGDNLPAERIHYEKSAMLFDLSGRIDTELTEKQKPEFNYLLN